MRTPQRRLVTISISSQEYSHENNRTCSKSNFQPVTPEKSNGSSLKAIKFKNLLFKNPGQSTTPNLVWPALSKLKIFRPWRIIYWIHGERQHFWNWNYFMILCVPGTKMYPIMNVKNLYKTNSNQLILHHNVLTLPRIVNNGTH